MTPNTTYTDDDARFNTTCCLIAIMTPNQVGDLMSNLSEAAGILAEGIWIEALAAAAIALEDAIGDSKAIYEAWWRARDVPAGEPVTFTFTGDDADALAGMMAA